MGDVQTSIDSLAKLNFEASDNWLLNKFASSADNLNVYTVKDIKQIFTRYTCLTDRWLMYTLLQCRVFLDLNDKSKPDAYKRQNISVKYARRETMTYCVYNILVLQNNEPILFKRITLMPCKYKVDRKSDQAKETDKLIGDGVGVAIGAVTASSSIAGVSTGVATVTAVATGATAASGGVLLPVALGALGAYGIFSLGKSAVGAVDHALVPRSKTFRFVRQEKSVCSYIVVKPAGVGMSGFPRRYNYPSVLCVAEDFWSEGFDAYRMYPMATKDLDNDVFVGLFGTTKTGWPNTQEELDAIINKYNKLIDLCK